MTRVNWRIDKLILSVYTGPVKASITLYKCKYLILSFGPCIFVKTTFRPSLMEVSRKMAVL